MIAFGSLYLEPSRNGVTKPKRVRGAGVKMVNMGEIFAHGRLRNVVMDRAPLSDAERISILCPGDLLFARQSLILSGAGKCSIFLEDKEEVCFESHIIRVRLDAHRADPLFAYYFFNGPQGRRAVSTIVEQGAGASGIRGSDLSKLMVQFPDVATQRAVGQTLGELDDKVELNRRMNETLDAMAQAIFRDWFVDFGPVRRKMEGATDPVAIMGGLTPDPARAAELAAMFPAKLNGDGRPDGWALCRVDELLELVYGKALPKQSRRDGTIPVYGSGGVGGWHDMPLEKGPSIIVGRKGTVGSLFWEPGPFFAIDTAFYVRPRRRFPLTYLWPLLRSLGLEGMNTDAAVPGLNRANVYRLEVPAPAKSLTDAFDEVAGPLYRMLQHNDAECSALSETRDYLLPRLVSGAVRIEGQE
jgi:type I restriction enzyme S subunit